MQENKEIKYLKGSDIKPLRKKLHKEQDGICPICVTRLSVDFMALDHQHKLFVNQPLLEDGAGLCRGVICMVCNAWEGKVSLGFKRMGLHKKEASMSTLLRNLADYLDRENLPFVHPREQDPIPKLKKQCYNKLKKVYKGRAKFPEYPKSKKVTKKLGELFKEYNLEIDYYK